MFPLWDMTCIIGLLFQFLLRQIALVDDPQLINLKVQVIVFNFNSYPVPRLRYKQADVVCIAQGMQGRIRITNKYFKN
jgi:hypothetical protein